MKTLLLDILKKLFQEKKYLRTFISSTALSEIDYLII